MLKIIKLFFCIPISFFSQEKNVLNDILIVDFTHSIHIEGMPNATVINAQLVANKQVELYEMNFMGNTNFESEQDSQQGTLLSIKSKKNDYIFKDNTIRSMYCVERILMKPFLVKDSLNIFNWKIENDFKEIIGYKCQKATATYRGRNYEAFFTTEIPFQTGPWKFCNLPGFILEANSVDGALKIKANKLQIENKFLTFENPFKKSLDYSISWDEFIVEYKKKAEELQHYRVPGGGTQSIPKRNIETYID